MEDVVLAATADDVVAAVAGDLGGDQDVGREPNRVVTGSAEDLDPVYVRQEERLVLGGGVDGDADVCRVGEAHVDEVGVGGTLDLQHARGEPAFTRRVELVRQLVWVERLAMGILILAPVLLILVRSPALMLLQIAAGLALLGIRVVVHVVTLPVEFDASFAKALPVLEGRGYLSGNDLPAARSVLRAAALTYVAAALATLLNIARWFRILRF